MELPQLSPDVAIQFRRYITCGYLQNRLPRRERKASDPLIYIMSETVRDVRLNSIIYP